MTNKWQNEYLKDILSTHLPRQDVIFEHAVEGETISRHVGAEFER